MDIKLTDDSGVFSFNTVNGDFEKDDSMETAINISLFTDRNAGEEYLQEQSRGWMGDLVSPVKERLIGSLLWTLDQSVLTNDTLKKSIAYAEEALSWMVEDGIASKIAVTGIIVPRSGIKLGIDITVDSEITKHYIELWGNTSA